MDGCGPHNDGAVARSSLAMAQAQAAAAPVADPSAIQLQPQNPHEVVSSPSSAASESAPPPLDPFSASYLSVQRPEWSSNYVNFDLLMDRVRQMQTHLMELRQRRRRRSYVNRQRHGSTLEESSFASRTGYEVHENISPRHRHHKSESFLPELAAAPPPPLSGKGPASKMKSPASSGNMLLPSAPAAASSSTSNLFGLPRNSSIDWIAGLATKNDWVRSESVASIASSDNSYLGDWVEPGSYQYEFCSLVDSELEKAVLFYLAETGRIAEEVSQLSKLPAVDGSNAVSRYERLGVQISDLYLFVGSNLTAIRKVLTRHDRIVKPDGKALCRYYIRTRRQGNTSHLQSLWDHNGLGAVYGSWRQGYRSAMEQELHGLEDQDTEWAVDVEGAASAKLSNDPCVNCIEAVAARVQDATHRSLQELVVLGSIGNTLSLEASVLAQTVDDKDWDMAFYSLSRSGLYGLVDMGILPAQLEDGIGVPLYLSPDMEEGVRATGLEYYLPLGLNLFSTFLYMCNYFIAGPTSAVYIETLGGNKALAGLVIGCTPWAAMASTLLFSFWTNWNFKHPLLFSGLCLFFGNLLYGLALYFNSIELVLIGRIGVGLGGPRYVRGFQYKKTVINRRYIADVTPMESRTAVSATFVTLSAAGTAVGPGLAAVVQRVDTSISLPALGTFVINGLTAPGYIMSIVWAVFIVVVALGFQEPERLGLNELKDKDLSPSFEDDSGNAAIGEKGPLLSNKGASTSPTAANNYSATAKGTKVAIDPQGDLNAIIESSTDDETDITGSSETSTFRFSLCFQSFTVPCWICIALLFVDKLTMEAIMSSVAIVGGHSFHWHVQQIGSLGVLMGALVVPLSIVIGAVSRYYEDRIILRALLLVSLLGLVMLIDIPMMFGEHPNHESREYSLFCVGPHKYIYGCLIAFCGLQCLESVIMSMLSKVVPHSLAKGFCNSGLINTETGTFGRAIGDVVVTLAGLASLDKMLNVLMIPLSCVLIICLVVIRCYYHALAV